MTFVLEVFSLLLSALRQLARTKATSAAAVVSVAVAVGCAAAAFCVADPIFFRPLPYAQPDDLFALRLATERSGVAGRLNLADLAALKELPGVRVAAFQPGARGRLKNQGGTVRSMAVTSEFFDLLGVPIPTGRKFTQEEHQAKSPVCVLAPDVANALFGHSSSAIGKSVVIEDVLPKVFTVVGVLPKGFLFPDTRVAPAMITPASERGRDVGTVGGDVQILARLSQGTDHVRLASQLQAIAASSEAQYSKLDRGRRTVVLPLSGELFGQVSRPTLVIFAAVLSIALLGCANLYHIFAVQVRRRSRDLGIAAALGASRLRLLVSLVIEYAIVGIIGAAGATLIAQLLRSYLIGELPEALAVLAASAAPINARVVIFVLLGALASVALAAAYPVSQVLREVARHDGLKDRSVSRTSSSRRSDRLLIVSQSAATFLVLMISLTILRSLMAINTQPMGFDYASFRLVQPLPPPAYFTNLAASRPQATRAAYDQLKTRFGSVVAANVGFPTGSTSGVVLAVNSVDKVEVPYYAVTGDFFGVAGLRLVAGRTFGEAESLTRTEKAVIDSVAAEKLWPGVSPLGKFLQADESSQKYQVIGVVQAIGRDLLQQQVRRGAAFLPIENRWGRLPMISFRAGSDVAVSEVAAVTEAAFPGVFVPNETVRPFRVQIARYEFLTALIGTIAAIDILIVMVGIWSLSVHQLQAERREFGVRMALGAEPANIVKMILTRRVLIPVMAGMALGGVAYLSFAGRMGELSFKTPAIDATTLGVSILAVVAAAVLPVIYPALKLARDPELLRQLR